MTQRVVLVAVLAVLAFPVASREISQPLGRPGICGTVSCQKMDTKYREREREIDTDGMESDPWGCFRGGVFFPTRQEKVGLDQTCPFLFRPVLLSS